MTEPDTRTKLAEVEEEIARLRSDLQGLTASLGGQSEGPMDPEDTAAAATNIEETQALLDVLEQRRETLRSKLGEA